MAVTWDPAKTNSLVILSNNNLTAQKPTISWSNCMTKGTNSNPALKVYFEIESNSKRDYYVGICENTCYCTSAGDIIGGESYTYYTLGDSQPTTYRVILDLQNKIFQVYKENTLAQNLVLNTSKTVFYPFLAMYQTGTGTITARFKKPFKYEIPQGFLPWDYTPGPNKPDNLNGLLIK